MQLRYYQSEAAAAAMDYLKRQAGNPVVILPTGSGKTPLVASIVETAINEHAGRVLVVSHSKEILGQACDTIKRFAPSIDVGVYSAGLGKRELENDCLICGIQSIHKRAHDVGRRHLIIVDEAHLIPPTAGTMYRNFIDKMSELNPRLKVLGLTATAYRTTTGRIYGKGELFNGVCYEAPIGKLIDEGYLTPISNQATATSISTEGMTRRAGEFTADSLAFACDKDAVVRPACAEVLKLASDRQSILVFGVSVSHVERIVETFREMGEHAEYITGDTPSLMRANIIERFKDGSLRVLVNCQVLTTGFDATRVDCVAVMRPTCSPGLFYQMVGRGLRLHDDKPDCLLLDYGGNIKRHGSLDDPTYGHQSYRGNGGGDAPLKTCPSCDEQSPISARQCDCGWEFPPSSMPRHDDTADTESTVLGKPAEPEWHTVEKIEWAQHFKRTWKKGDPTTLRVDYHWEGQSLTDRPFSEWICIEHSGWVREKAEAWWQARTLAECPRRVDDAIDWRDRCAIADTRRILVGADPKNPKYTRIHAYELGEVPSKEDWQDAQSFVDDDVPF